MRIALVVPYCLDSPGGVATHALGLAVWLQRRGHSPHVFAPGTRRIQREVPVTLLGPAISVPFNGSVAQLALLPRQGRRALHRSDDFDVVHVHEPLTPGLGFAVASRIRRPLVVTHHAAFEPSSPVAGLLRRRAARLPPRVTIAVSQSAADLVHGFTRAPVRIVPNAIELPAAPEPRQQGRPRVVFVGRAGERRKGFGVFVQVASAVPEADFIAVGKAPTRVSGVTMLGPIGDAALGDVLASADVLVAPNLFGESFGMILVEALSHGAAVVASDLPAFRALTDDRRLATFFPVGDAVEAARRLRERLAHPVDPMLAWRSAGRFSWESVGPAIEDAYRDASLMHHGFPMS